MKTSCQQAASGLSFPRHRTLWSPRRGRLSVKVGTGLCAIAAILSVGCGAAVPARPLAPSKPAPATINDSTFDESLRRFWVLDVQAPERVALRARLVQHLAAKLPNLISGDDYSGVIERFASITALYSPAEIGKGLLPRELEAAARYLYDRGSPRGDEARVLSALVVLSSVRPAEPQWADLYQRIQAWGFDSRSAGSMQLDRFEAGSVEVWQEHARLTPTPQALTTLSRLYLERRNALVAMFQSSGDRMPFNASVLEGMHRTALSVAAVYLRFGDVASALTQVEAMGTSSGGIERRLAELLRLAKEDGNEGAGALLDLNRAYLEDGRTDVSRGLCLVGLRQRPDDARFPQCLARIAATETDFGGAMAWYGEAVRLMPEERSLYDEILEVLSRLMEQGFGSDASQTQAIAVRAAELLQERMKRWPDTPLAIRPEDLYIMIGIADMNAGDAGSAEARLRKSVETRPTLNGLLQLGMLLERMNRGAEAAAIYGRALQLSSEEPDSEGKSAEILERLGDTLRMLGKADEAGKMYQRGLALWDQNLSQQKGQRIGLAQLRRGVLLGRLARRNDSVNAFREAMKFAPDARETYATILVYLAVSQPDGAFAQQVFHNALNQLSLEPEWKVYFALWLRMISGRAGQPTEPEIDDMFQDLAKGDDWWASLAQFGSGKLRFEALLSEAADAGERAEAYFYEGARLLGEGDAAGARAMFQRVLESRMVNFYEYAMAQELLPSIADSAHPH